jgi:NADPH2:quinone reductase
MRAVHVEQFGPPEVLRVQDTEPPSPAPGQVVVAVEVAGVVFGDVLVRSGRYPFPLPYVPGLEVGGRVVRTGRGTDPSLQGRRVVATTSGRRGGYAELAVADADAVFEVPDGLPLKEAVPVFQAGAVAAGMLAAMRVGPEDTVLVTAAAGRIGSLLVRLCRQAGARQVIAAAGNAEKLAAASLDGADTLIGYTDPDWAGNVTAATGGRGADVVFDAVGGAVREQALLAARPNAGRIAVYGATSGDAAIDALSVGRLGLTVVGALGIAFSRPDAEQRGHVRHVLKLAAAGELRPRVHAAYPLERAADAHAALEQRATVGAVLLTP